MSRPRLLPTMLHLLPWVLGSAIAAVGGLLLFRHFVPWESLRRSNDVVGNYLQTLGTVYAVLLAFVVYMVWAQFNETRGYVEQEASETLDLYRVVQGFPPEARGPLEERVRAYVDAVLEGEWTALAARQDEPLKRGGVVLDGLWAVLREFEPRTPREEAVFGDALARFNDLSDLRTHRLTASGLRVPLALRVLLLAGAVMTVASMYLFGVESVAIHAFITGALAGAISHVLYVIADLDTCFSGQFRVSQAAFLRVRDAIALVPIGTTTGPPLSLVE